MNEFEPLKAFYVRAVGLAPRAALVLALLVAGLIASAVLRRLARWLTRRTGVEAMAESAGVSKMLYTIGAKRGLAELIGSLAWIAGLLVTFAAIADVLALPAVSALTALAVRFLPKLFAAGAVLLGGLWVAALVRRLLRRLAERDKDLESPDLVAQLAYYLIVVVTVTWAAEQADISTGIIDSLLKIVLGLALAALALAFGLGFRTAFESISARHYYERMLQPGDKIRVGDTEGVVLRFSAIAIIVQTELGERIIPCRTLLNVEPLEDDAGGDDDA